MLFKNITYTSLAALDLTDDQLRDILGSANALNGIDGITGLLIFNGVQFLQWIEGPPDAVDELVERLRRDPRHSAFEIRHEDMAEQRMFGDWQMKLVRVPTSLRLAQDDVAPRLPAELPDHVRDRIMDMVGRISETVDR